MGTEIRLVSYTLRNNRDRRGPLAVVTVARTPDGTPVRGIAILGWAGKGREAFDFATGKSFADERALAAAGSRMSALPVGSPIRGVYRKVALDVMTEYVRSALLDAMRSAAYSERARLLLSSTPACQRHLLAVLQAGPDARKEIKIPGFKSEFGAGLTRRERTLLSLDTGSLPAHCVRVAELATAPDAQ